MSAASAPWWPDLPGFLDTAATAARAAGELQRQAGETGQVSEVGEAGQPGLAAGAGLAVADKGRRDIVTAVDHACERLIVEMIQERHPGHDILAEEGQGSRRGSPWLWLVDPLDGTKNFAHHHPRSCVSIALAREGEVVAGAVFNPWTGELFLAGAGLGASENGRPIRVSPETRLERAMIASALTFAAAEPGQAEDGPRTDRRQLERLVRVHQAARAVRSSGCCALDLCDVARGRFEAYFEPGLGPWDTAAGALMVREAGGRVTTFSGAPHDPFSPSVLATNQGIFAALAALVAG